MYQQRKYREKKNDDRFAYFRVQEKETDLWIGITPRFYQSWLPGHIVRYIMEIRREIETYILKDPAFVTTHVPLDHVSGDEAIILQMAEAGKKAGVGPMAAVAGVISGSVAKKISGMFPSAELVIENGGDIAAVFSSSLVVRLETDNHGLLGDMGVLLHSALSPCGICSSSGSFGHSLSYGKADLVSVVCNSPALADAWATSLCNIIQSAGDLEKVDQIISVNAEIIACVAVVKDKMLVYGDIELLQL